MLDWLALITLAGALPWAAWSLFRLRRLLHILQLEEYESGRFVRWLVSEPRRLAPLGLAVFAGLLLLAMALTAAGAPAPVALAALAVLWAGAGVVALSRRPASPAKKPLVLTPRALVILAGGAVLWVLVAAAVALAWTTLRGGGLVGFALAVAAGFALAEAVVPGEVLLTSLALYPVQSATKAIVVQAARARLCRSRARVIGITGSYGKTSTKEILATLLSARHRVLRTPESYNTPLGISKVILRQLRPEHEFFVVEMGAYRQGDIRYLCGISRPQVGILTAVSPQHLERFKSVESIAAAKYELIEALPADGVAIFNNDNAWCRELADRTGGRVVRYGLEDDPRADVVARDVRVTRRGLELRLAARGQGEVDVRVGLLGRHNAGNVVAAAAAALACGMTLEEIARAAEAIRPVPHRLQLIDGAGGVTVIDDAYNANPDGARAALEVLREFTDGRKVLVTPGMIELGEREAAENRAFGEQAAAVCDAVILVGPRRTAPIRDGLLSAGYPPERIQVVRGVAEVPDRLRGLVGPSDVVLFENDLPDNYSEE